MTDLSLDTIPIHPLYARENWSRLPVLAHNPPIPIGDGKRGYFEVSILAFETGLEVSAYRRVQARNPLVWNAILPAIRLASLILVQGHAFPC